MYFWMYGAFASYTERGPPDKMNPFGWMPSTVSAGASHGNSSQYTCASRTRRAISCAYWEPKSRIAIESGIRVHRYIVRDKMKVPLWEILIVAAIDDQPVRRKVKLFHEALDGGVY